MSDNREKYIAIPVLLILWFSGFIFPSAVPMVMIGMTLVSIRLIVLFRNVQPVFMFYIFHLTYVVLLIPFFIYDIPITGHSEFQTAKYMDSTLLIHGAFVYSLYFFSDLNIPDRPIIFSQNLPKRSDKAIFLLLVCIMLAIIINMWSGSVNIYAIDADQGWSTYTENISGTSGVSEYFLIFFLTAFIFAKKNSSKRILAAIFILFTYVAFTIGMRVTLVMPVLLLFALFMDGKIKTRYIFIMSIIGMMLVQAAGLLRDGKRALVELFTIYGGTQMLTNQGEVFYTSNVIVSAIIDGLCGVKERAFSLLAASLQVILPPRFGLGSEGKPAIYVWNLTERAAGGGGLISTFFYFWLDYFGVVLIAFFIAMVTNKAIKKPTPLLSIYIICLYSFSPRWLAYDPVNFLFRLPLYAIGLYLILMHIKKTMSRPSLAEDGDRMQALQPGATH